MLDDLDLSVVTDPEARRILGLLLNVIEAQAAEIATLLAWPVGAWTRRAIEEYLASGERAEGTNNERGGEASSRGSVEQYLRTFEASGGDIRALVPATTRGDAGGSRLDREREEIIQGVLAECRAAPAQRTARAVYYMVIERVRVRNQGRPAAERLALPGLSTIERRVRAVGATVVLRRRPGPGERRPGPRVERPLERVELDHTVLDLIVVDEEDRLPIGRPTVTLALDVYSGLPAGLRVGFEAAGYEAAMQCLLHAILPKEDARARYGTKNGWLVYGLPETLVVDRAPHLVGGDLGDACGPLRIALEPSPVKRPWFKGAVKWQFRTHNTGLVHGLPGTTFSHVLARGEYDSAGLACISLARFREILHVYLLDMYGQEWNQGVGGASAQRWAASRRGRWRAARRRKAATARAPAATSARSDASSSPCVVPIGVRGPHRPAILARGHRAADACPHYRSRGHVAQGGRRPSGAPRDCDGGRDTPDDGGRDTPDDSGRDTPDRERSGQATDPTGHSGAPGVTYHGPWPAMRRGAKAASHNHGARPRPSRIGDACPEDACPKDACPKTASCGIYIGLTPK